MLFPAQVPQCPECPVHAARHFQSLDTALPPLYKLDRRDIKSQKRKFVLSQISIDNPPSLQIMIVIDVQLGYYILNQG